MVDHTLTGNCRRCEACELRREGMDLGAMDRPEVPCNECGGTGIIPLTVAQIIADHVAWAREHFWQNSTDGTDSNELPHDRARMPC